ncbi:DUF4136 domain-containing protein [Sungkyunkwania multivorans]|uniref:DUF4136 domain-containing protein n=1 Tax=Sungkyunkwania multivorans TaxID=1173618 RepID=A0ABW3CTN6_9FLAO
MKRKHTPYIFLFLLMVSCAGIKVNYDYDREADFSQYKTYNYFDDMDTGMSPLDTKRLIDVLNTAMQSKGFVLSEEPDFLIDIQSGMEESANNSSVGVGMGGTGRSVGGGVSVGIPLGSRLVREIQFDFVDASSKSLFWQAVSSNSYNENASPEKREANFKNLVVKVLERYPPSR